MLTVRSTRTSISEIGGFNPSLLGPGDEGSAIVEWEIRVKFMFVDSLNLPDFTDPEA